MKHGVICKKWKWTKIQEFGLLYMVVAREMRIEIRIRIYNRWLKIINLRYLIRDMQEIREVKRRKR